MLHDSTRGWLQHNGEPTQLGFYDREPEENFESAHVAPASARCSVAAPTPSSRAT